METYIEKLEVDLKPYEIYEIFKAEKNSSFLDSGRDYDSIGRYSFIGINPFITFKFINNNVYINGKYEKCDPFVKLKEIVNLYKSKNNIGLPFISGGIGYFSYDLSKNIEISSCKDIEVPDIYFNFYDNIIIFDNLRKETYISALGVKNSKAISINEIKNKIYAGRQLHTKVNFNRNSSIKFQSNFLKEDYIAAINKIKKYIENGDAYVVNLTQRFKCKIKEEPFEIYKRLRKGNPAPFAAYLNLENLSVLSSSPERFINLHEGNIITTPIKGTTPRGENEEEDQYYRLQLFNSEKDKSELLMIVDLERNDLSKVCIPGTVKVIELFKIEKYATVFHLVSTISGKLKKDNDFSDLIKAVFPGGSITGAPKIRAMEIIDELEVLNRNIYTGSIGYIGFDGNLDLNIAIRTINIKDETAYFGVGGGITYESDSESEYEETLIKAKALIKAIKGGVN